MLCVAIYLRYNSSSLLGSYTRYGNTFFNCSFTKIYFELHGTQKLFISDNFKSFKFQDIINYLRAVNIIGSSLQRSPIGREFHEGLIRVMKNLLKKAMGIACLTYEEILTVLVKIESINSSQSWKYMSNNHNESFFSPYHFIYERHVNGRCYKK